MLGCLHHMQLRTVIAFQNISYMYGSPIPSTCGYTVYQLKIRHTCLRATSVIRAYIMITISYLSFSFFTNHVPCVLFSDFINRGGSRNKRGGGVLLQNLQIYISKKKSKFGQKRGACAPPIPPHNPRLAIHVHISFC